MSRRIQKHDWLEILIYCNNPSPNALSEICDFYFSLGIHFNDLAVSDFGGMLEVKVYTKSWRKVKNIESKFTRLKIKKLKIRTTLLTSDAWFDKWKLDYHIGPLGTKFVIVPLWERSRYKQNKKIPVFLDPKGSFGSGLHETTKLMVRLLEGFEGRLKSYLDVGMGSGILSVVAEKLGAREIEGFDTDMEASKTARFNFRLNKCRNGKFYRRDLGKIRTHKKFDLVGANMLSGVLVGNARKIISFVKPGGYLVVSGILTKDVTHFKREFPSSGLRCIKQLNKGKWSALCYKKGASTSEVKSRGCEVTPRRHKCPVIS